MRAEDSQGRGGPIAKANRSAISALLVVLMVVGCLVLWVGIPAAWLWVGSQVQGSGRSLATALLVIIAGIAVSIAVVLKLLTLLSRAHIRVRRAQGREPKGLTALELVLLVTAAIALTAFFIWFLAFSGSSPVPLSPIG